MGGAAKPVPKAPEVMIREPVFGKARGVEELPVVTMRDLAAAGGDALPVVAIFPLPAMPLRVPERG